MTEPATNEFPEPATLRLFFALWPDDATRDALNRTGKWLHQHWGGRPMRVETVHITLAFLGETPAERLDDLVACADAARSDGFELILDQAGYWRHNRIGWLGASQTPPQYVELVGALNAALQGAGFPVDSRPHVPHVTLLRKSPGGEALACKPVRWPIGDFVLVKSATGSEGAHYDVIRRWSLA
ncbi:MAG: RNA 2',3'-cyclic phosphodiesterase [Thiobacillus sp.]|uniref:RNA 2',3'-cyclic phosphodiesterase n=1 Tax=Thiobacillus sp. TaxID=924 RepID=UPI002895210E|nr:RNA 2',3'-cyclic phosphodiesterase [Thiobacillus sp.]MDT3707423.1 RNA 2',3'-cyclic phosphodiesterase [Thiobacillus sp.]